MLCSFLYACSFDQVTKLLFSFAVFAVLIIMIIGMTRIGIEYERRKRAQYDFDALFRGIHRSRGDDGG